jgi:hypothetical protein
MAIKDTTREVARRRAIFEAHIRDCEDCEVKTDKDGFSSTAFCMSGQIMVTNFVRAIQADK